VTVYASIESLGLAKKWGTEHQLTEAERQELERHSEVILKALINAAKADGRIDASEIRRIVGKLQELGVDSEAQQYVMTEMQKPMETEKLIAADRGRAELAAEIYGAFLLAIEVDIPGRKNTSISWPPAWASLRRSRSASRSSSVCSRCESGPGIGGRPSGGDRPSIFGDPAHQIGQQEDHYTE